MPNQHPSYSRTLSSRLDEIPRLADELESWAHLHGVQIRIINSVNLMLDELITNIVTHGYQQGNNGRIDVKIDLNPSNINVLLRDYGPPFNILETLAPDVRKDIEGRSIGGLGIHFVRRMADHVSYKRDGNANEVRLTKKIYSPQQKQHDKI